MNPAAQTCPSRELLAGFGLGLLDGGHIEAIHAHLETCVGCRMIVAGLVNDDFVDRLHRAYGPGAEQALYSPATLADTPAPAATADTPTGSWSQMPVSASDPPIESGLQAALLPGSDYEVLRELGRGGMGIVYLARNRLMDRLEVLKVISRRLVGRPGSLERFQQEIRSAARLNHPSIVVAYRVLQLQDVLAFVMEYVPGEDLASLVKRRGPLPVVNAAFYAYQIASGLQHAHSKGMVHRDIKPSNLMLTIERKQHVVKILDFGLSKISTECLSLGLTESGQVLGTPEFMAPEQARDAHRADIRADIYSLGCTLYYLLSGTAPFQSKNVFEMLRAHREAQAKPLNMLRADVPAELAAVVARMMAKQPEERYKTPLDAARALAPFFKQSGGKPTDQRPQLPPAAEPAAVVVPPPVIVPIVNPQAVLASEPAAGRQLVKAEPRALGLAIPAYARKRWRIGRWPLAGLLLAGVAIGGAMKFMGAPRQGTLLLAVNQAHPAVIVDGNELAVAWDPDGKQGLVDLAVGPRTIELRKVGFQPITHQLVVQGGARQMVISRFESAAVAATGEIAAATLAGGKPSPAVAPFNARDAQAYQEAWAAYLKVPVEQTNSIGITLRLIPPGTFQMGSTPEQLAAAVKLDDPSISAEKASAGQNALAAEMPQHRVTISKSFLIASTELTVTQFRQFVDATQYVSEIERLGGGGRYDAATKKTNRDPKLNWRTPSYPITDDSPAPLEADDAIAFCNWLSTAEKLKPCYQRKGDKPWTPVADGNGYRLPTEAEWEYACRAGQPTLFAYGDDAIELERYDWYSVGSGRAGHPVGKKTPNAFGLYDVHGNVHECCQDWFDAGYYAASPAVDPLGPESGAGRVFRSGCFYATRNTCRVAHRGYRAAGSFQAFESFGARIVRVSLGAEQTAPPTSSAP